ncbi:MAG: hypothetical protein P1V51_04505 [Deltaproteobacteria bacterium]|nr:hypothetical protein [Deltaproteobacteria bacterium]
MGEVTAGSRRARTRRKGRGGAGPSLGGLILLAVLVSGCGQEEQTAACAAFVICVEARDEQGGRTTDLERFREGGACWGSRPGQTLCDRACTRGLAFLRERYTPLPEACTP